MPAERMFLDSNVICYLFGRDQVKAICARELLGRKPMISVQILAEVCNVASLKGKLDWSEIEELIGLLMNLCEIGPLTNRIHEQGRQIAGRTGYTIFDSQIIAAAIDMNCGILWSEDMQHGHRVMTVHGGVLIKNPFLEGQGRAG